MPLPLSCPEAKHLSHTEYHQLKRVQVDHRIASVEGGREGGRRKEGRKEGERKMKGEGEKGMKCSSFISSPPHTRESRLMKRWECLRSSLYARQHKSQNCWNCDVGLSPSLITYAISRVRTKGVRSLCGMCILLVNYNIL